MAKKLERLDAKQNNRGDHNDHHGYKFPFEPITASPRGAKGLPMGADGRQILGDSIASETDYVLRESNPELPAETHTSLVATAQTSALQVIAGINTFGKVR